VPDTALPPPPRFATGSEPRRHSRWLAPLAAAAVVLAVVGSVLGLESGSGHRSPQQAAGPSTVATSPTAARTSLASPSVAIRMAATDGETYGVGMPVVAYFAKRFGNAQPFAAATSVTVDGKPVQAAWYFELSGAKGYPIAGHLRMRDYWPAHADVHVAIAANAITRAVSLDFHTGARTVAIVSDAKHELSVTSDGKTLGSFPVSLGTAATPTEHGIKVIMAKRPSICLSGPGFAGCGIKYAQQLTNSGEYLIAAPWNPGVKGRWDSSNGCTNLTTGDARFLYEALRVGDVVQYLDTNGPAMQAGGGFGDWNVPWSVWLKGGLIPTG
jgi:lipoprotein-anchoring transpeptidase ErfK/SrfK